MSDVTMPKPVAYLYVSPNGNAVNVRSYDDIAPGVNKFGLITTDQAEAYAAAKVRESAQWVSVNERLPDKGLMVLVYSPPQPGDWPDSIRIEFDCIDPDSDDPCWHNHSEHYEHYCCIAKGGSDIEWSGPSEKAPYTHWMPPPPIP